MSADQDLIAEAEEFVNYGSDLNPVEADRLIRELCAALSRAEPEAEWEYGCRSSAHHEPVTLVIGLDVDEPEDHGFDCPSPALVRRRKAGPWEEVPDAD